MNRLLRSWNALWSLAEASYKFSTAYRMNILFFALGSLLQIVLMASVWTALDLSGALSSTGGRGTWITYSVVAFSLNSLFSMFAVMGFLTDKIRKGDIALELVRPVNFQLHLFLRYVGSSLFRLIFVCVPFVLVGAVFMGVFLPSDPAAWGTFILSALLGYVIHFEIWFLFGMLTFYSLDNSGIFLLFLSLLNLFSGLYIPLWAYPSGLRELTMALPFHGVYATPLEAWLRGPSPDFFWNGMLPQILWALALWAAGWLMWRSIQKRVEIQGG